MERLALLNAQTERRKSARLTDLGREGVFENVSGGKRSILECFPTKKYVCMN